MIAGGSRSRRSPHSWACVSSRSERGRVVWEALPGEEHYNPIGTVHAGFATTLLDSAMGTAFVSTAERGHTLDDARAEGELHAGDHRRHRHGAVHRASSSTGAGRSSRPRRGSRTRRTAPRARDQHDPRSPGCLDTEAAPYTPSPDGAAVRPGRRRAPLAGDVGGRGPLRRRRRPAPRRLVRDLRAAAQRHRRAAHGPRAERLDPGRPDPLAPDARLRHALAARLRPRRDLDPERDREAAASPRGRRARRSAATRSSSGRGAGSTTTGRTIMGQYRRLGASLDYSRERFTMDDGVRRGGDDVLRPALGRGLDLPREPDRQLVPVPPDGDLRPRGRARRDGRHPVRRPLPVRRR